MWTELHDHLKETNQSTDDFGKKIGVKGATVRRYIAKTRRPGADEFNAIYEQSGHKVHPNSFYGIPSGVTVGGNNGHDASQERRGQSPECAGGDLSLAAGQLTLFAGASS